MLKIGRRPRFGETATLYERYRSTYPAAAYRRLFALIPRWSYARGSEHPPLKILDLGCGTGKSTEGLLRRGIDVVCVDPDPLMLRVTRKKFAHKRHVRVVRASAERLPFADASFDALTIGKALHWFNNPRAINEMARVLKPGGVLYVLEMHQVGESPLRKLYARYRYKPISKNWLTTAETTTVLRKSGLNGIRCFSVKFVSRFTVAERLGYLHTVSRFLVLPPRDRVDFLVRARRMLEERRGDKRYLMFPRVAQICYGVKPLDARTLLK